MLQKAARKTPEKMNRQQCFFPNLSIFG